MLLLPVCIGSMTQNTVQPNFSLLIAYKGSNHYLLFDRPSGNRLEEFFINRWMTEDRSWWMPMLEANLMSLMANELNINRCDNSE